MPSGRSLFKRIQQLLDGPGALGSGDNAKVLAWNNGTQRFEMVAQASGGGTPGGSTTQVQYNNAGAFAGDAGMTYDAANDALTLVGRLVSPVWRPASDGTAALKIKTAADGDFVTFNTTNKRVLASTTVGASTLNVGGDAASGNKNAIGVYTPAGQLVIELQAANAAYGPLIQFPTGAGGFDMFNYRFFGADGTYGYKWTTHDGSGGSPSRLTISGNAATAIIAVLNSYLAVGQSTATALVDIAAATVARAGLRVRNGVRPTANGGNPFDGDIWSVGGHLYWRDGGVDHQLDN